MAPLAVEESLGLVLDRSVVCIGGYITSIVRMQSSVPLPPGSIGDQIERQTIVNGKSGTGSIRPHRALGVLPSIPRFSKTSFGPWLACGFGGTIDFHKDTCPRNLLVQGLLEFLESVPNRENRFVRLIGGFGHHSRGLLAGYQSTYIFLVLAFLKVDAKVITGESLSCYLQPP